MWLSFLPSFSYDIEVGGLYFNELSFIGKKVSLTASPDDKRYSGNISIPATIDIDGATFKVATIESNAFVNCTGLTSLSIGANVETIEEGAFAGCSSLKTISFDDSELSIYLNPQETKASSIGFGTFWGCPLDSVYVGRNMEFQTGQPYGTSPFYEIQTLRSVKFGEKVTEVARCVFFSNRYLSLIELGNNIKIIHGEAFSAASIKSIIIPESVDSIGSQVFQFCKNLKKAIVLRKEPIALSFGAFDTGGYAGYNILGNCWVYVPAGCLEAYREAPEWKRFGHILEIVPDSLVLDSYHISLTIGDKVKPQVSCLPDYAETPTLEWSSSDTSIATVNEDGEITAVGVGEAVITVTVPNTNVSCSLKVIVSPVLISSISFDKNEISLGFGEQVQLIINILPENATNKKIEWYSSNPETVVVSDGLITRIGSGDAVIMAMTSDGTNLVARCTIKDSTTGIKDAYSLFKNTIDSVFDVNGSRVTKNVRGIVVKNGKKFINK